MDYTNLSFREFLACKALSDPDRVILVDKEQPYTWSDIDRGSSAIARDLERMGVSKRSRVGFAMTNSMEFVMGFFAVQKLGAIVLLINPSQLAEDIGSTALVGDATHMIYGDLPGMKSDPDFAGALITSAGLTPDKTLHCHFDDLRAFIDGCGGCEPFADVSVEADDVAVMIFTSGSTGKPKGVMHSAYNILNAATLNSIDQTLNASDRTCLILPLFHIFGLVAGLFANAVADSMLYIPKNIHALTVMETIDRYKCTIFHSVPTMLLAIVNNRDFKPERVSSVRCTIISGAAATQAQIELFKKMMPNNRFLSSYGLSEMAPVSISSYNADDDVVLHTVGHLVKGVNVRIIDPATRHDRPEGIEGEIIVKSTILMTGYYRLSADDQAIDETGWIHTGDLGYIRDDGNLVLSGRLKELIIRGGENIMPVQVESVISEFDMIENVRVYGVPSEYYGEEVAACIILKPGAGYNEDEFRSALSQKLAKFRMPTYIEVYERFPVLGTGKIDNVRLKDDLLKRLGMNKQ